METPLIMTKEEIIVQLEQDLKKKSVEDLVATTKHLSSKYKEAEDVEEKQQLEKFVEEGGHPNDFIAEKNPLDGKFKELFNLLLEKKTAYKKEITEKEEGNYQAKLQILEQLKALTEDEQQNLGATFQKFYALRDEWEAVGAVNQARYKQLQYDYSHLKDIFYYNVKIHRELKNYDFKKNGEKKEEIIKKLQGLKEVSSIRQLEHFIKEYQDEWDAIGPATQDKWETLKNTYWDLVNEVYEKIRLHYKNIRELQKNVLENKEALLAKMEEIVGTILNEWGLKDWNKATEKIKTLQQEWKEAGYTKKAKENELFEVFGALADDFFGKKKVFFEKLKEKQGKRESRKEALIEKAEHLKVSKDWKNTSQELINLQKEWKKIPPAHFKIENKLWEKFRSACDTFFESKKEYFDTLDDRKEENLEVKQKGIEAIENAKTKDELVQGLEIWYGAFEVPKNQIKKALNELDKTVKKALETVEDKNIEMTMFKAKVKALKNSDNNELLIKDEKRFIQSKIQKIKEELNQYENNLSFFGPSKGAQKLKEAVENKMATAEKEMKDWEQKLKLLE